jgi:AraC-like DNA-binding protein
MLHKTDERVHASQIAGVTRAMVVDHVETVRVDAACNPIEEIARVCGFGTPETMNRVFRPNACSPR